MTVVIVAIVISAFFGGILGGIMIAYMKFLETVQQWSDAFSPPRRWVRRIIHFSLMVIAILVVLYGYLTYASVVIPMLRDLSTNRAALLTLFVLSNAIIFLPLIIFRKSIFRPVKVRKLWE